MYKGGSKKCQTRRTEKTFVEIESEFKVVFVPVSKDKLDFFKKGDCRSKEYSSIPGRETNMCNGLDESRDTEDLFRTKYVDLFQDEGGFHNKE